VGQELYIDWNFARMLSYADVRNYFDYEDLVGERLVMRSDGLVIVN